MMRFMSRRAETIIKVGRMSVFIFSSVKRGQNLEAEAKNNYEKVPNND